MLVQQETQVGRGLVVVVTVSSTAWHRSGMMGGVAGWQSVDSNAVEAYRWRDGVLELRFVDNGQVYEYPCDEALLARFLGADSKGAFVNRVLKPLEQRARTRAQFALQSHTFESRGYVFTDEGILGWIEAHTPVRGDDRILDVAGGTGALGRHLVRSAASCVVLDLVPEMLARGAAQATATSSTCSATRPRCRSRTRSST